MEGIVYRVAEWISLREMEALRSACTLVSSKAREKEYEEFLSDQDNQVWKEMSEEWQQYLMGKEESPAIPRCGLTIAVSCWAKTTESQEGRAASFAG